MKKFYDFEEAINNLEWAEEMDLPYKFVRTTESVLNDLTDEMNVITVYLFKFL